MASPFDQSRYQVRMEWGTSGLERVAASDVVVVVDVLRFSSTVARRIEAGETVALDAAAHALSLNGAAVAARAAESDAVVFLGALVNAAAVAAAVMAEQQRRAARTSILVIAAGELSSRRRPSRRGRRPARRRRDRRCARALGIDHTSPEAAAAGEAFRGLRPALRHLLTAGGSGQELIDRGLRDDVLAAAQVDAVSSAPVLRDGTFAAYA
jgi:2-phosphosulfolactate phosphatase